MASDPGFEWASHHRCSLGVEGFYLANRSRQRSLSRLGASGSDPGYLNRLRIRSQSEVEGFYLASQSRRKNLNRSAVVDCGRADPSGCLNRSHRNPKARFPTRNHLSLTRWEAEDSCLVRSPQNSREVWVQNWIRLHHRNSPEVEEPDPVAHCPQEALDRGHANQNSRLEQACLAFRLDPAFHLVQMPAQRLKPKPPKIQNEANKLSFLFLSYMTKPPTFRYPQQERSQMSLNKL